MSRNFSRAVTQILNRRQLVSRGTLLSTSLPMRASAPTLSSASPLTTLPRPLSSSTNTTPVTPTAPSESINNKDEAKKKFSVFDFVGEHKRAILVALALYFAYWRLTVNRREAAEAAAKDMVSIDNEVAGKFQEILLLQEEDVNEILAAAQKIAVRGMVDVDHMALLVQAHVQQKREERFQMRQKLREEADRIAAEVRAQMEAQLEAEANGGNVPATSEASPVAAVTPTAAPTAASSSPGWWPFSSSSSSASAPAAATEEKAMLPSLELSFPDWLDDEEADEATVHAWDPMILFSKLPYGTLGRKHMVNLTDVSLALANIINCYITPGDKRHPTALPVSMLNRAEIDMEKLFEAYKHRMETREGLGDYIDVLTGARHNLDKCVERAEQVMKRTQCGHWDILEPEEQVRLAQRLHYVYRYSKLSRFYKRRIDTHPEQRLELIWKCVGDQPLSKPQLALLFRKMLAAGHFASSALYKQTSLWPVAFKSVSGLDIANAYYDVLHKPSDEPITLEEFVKAARIHGVLNKHHLWYMMPEMYSTLTDFQAWKLMRKYQLFGIPENVTEFLDDE